MLNRRLYYGDIVVFKYNNVFVVGSGCLMGYLTGTSGTEEITLPAFPDICDLIIALSNQCGYNAAPIYYIERRTEILHFLD